MKKGTLLFITSILLITSATSFALNGWPTENTTPMQNSDLFYDYKSWKTGNIKNHDPLFILISTQLTWYLMQRGNNSLIQDINWDWLPDIMVGYYWIVDDKIPWCSWWIYAYSYALLVNKWNMDYDISYRCVKRNACGYEPALYYWDCVKESNAAPWPNI